MLSRVHTAPPIALARPAAARGAAVASQAPRRLLGARTLEEVRERVDAVLRGVCHDAIRVELHVVDTRGEFVRVEDRDAITACEVPVAEAGTSCLAGTPERRSRRPLPLLRCRGPSMSAPLLGAHEERIGLLAVEAPPGAPDFTRLHANVLDGIAALASLAVQRLRPQEPEQVRVRRESDRRAASRMQRRLLGGALPTGCGVVAFTEYRPALDVGGDFFCLRDVGDGTIAAAIGDVSGNGMSAALLMSRVAADVDRALATGSQPSAVLAAVNASLSDVESETFVTAACLRLDTRTRNAVVANAGHPPLVVRRADGQVFTCGDASGMPLGMAPCEYDDDEILLDRGDIVLLVTDGVLEALDHPSGQRGMALLLELLQTTPHDAKAIHQRVHAAVDRAASTHVLDDVTWVVLQVNV